MSWSECCRWTVRVMLVLGAGLVTVESARALQAGVGPIHRAGFLQNQADADACPPPP
jgi:hypothetical protein